MIISIINYLWSSGATASRFSIVLLLRFLGGKELRGASSTFRILLSSFSRVAFGPARVTFEVEKLEDWVIADWAKVVGSMVGSGGFSSLGRKRSISSVWIIRMTEFWMWFCHAMFSSIRTRLVTSSSSGRQSTVAGERRISDLRVEVTWKISEN